MKVQYDPDLIKTLKKANVKIRKSLEKKIAIFSKNPNDPRLNNHPLRDKYQGHRSIDITADYRAIYKEIGANGNSIAYFIALGKHNQLYK